MKHHVGLLQRHHRQQRQPRRDVLAQAHLALADAAGEWGADFGIVQGVARQFARCRGFLQLRLALGERRLRLASPALQYVPGGALAAFLGVCPPRRRPRSLVRRVGVLQALATGGMLVGQLPVASPVGLGAAPFGSRRFAIGAGAADRLRLLQQLPIEGLQLRALGFQRRLRRRFAGLGGAQALAEVARVQAQQQVAGLTSASSATSTSAT